MNKRLGNMKLLRITQADKRLRYEQGDIYIFEGNMEQWYSKLRKIAKDNPDGFTVTLMDLEPVTAVKNRYVVALTNETIDYWEYRTHIERWLKVVLEKVIKWYRENGGEDYPLVSIGGWRNPEDGKYYVDIGLVVYREDLAIEIGKQYHQKAIFNLYNSKTIDL